MAVIDITRAWPETAASVLQKVLGAISETPGPQIEIYARTGHDPKVADLAEAHGATLIVTDESDWALTSKVAQSVERMLELTSPVQLFSFSPAVKHMAAAFGGRVTFSPLAPYSRAEAQRAQWDETFMPAKEAAGFVAKAISKRPTQAAWKTDLRPLLESLDPRFSKDAGGPASVVGFISLLTELAHKRGLVTLTGSEPRVHIALTEEGRRVAAGVVADAASHQGAQVVQAAHETTGTRSDRFMALWRSANLGPFQSVRTKVYDEIDRAIAAGEPRKLKTLVSEAVKAVRAADPAHPEKYPWSRVTTFLEGLMRRRPVAVSGDGPVARTWANGELEVTQMVDEWRLLLDGELVLHLVDHGMELRIDDVPDLAGALYGGRTEDDLERAHDVVRRLIQDGLLADSPAEESLRRAVVTPVVIERAPEQGTRDLRLASGEAGQTS
jgi:hypothetical protein